MPPPPRAAVRRPVRRLHRAAVLRLVRHPRRAAVRRPVRPRHPVRRPRLPVRRLDPRQAV